MRSLLTVNNFGSGVIYANYSAHNPNGVNSNGIWRDERHQLRARSSASTPASIRRPARR